MPVEFCSYVCKSFVVKLKTTCIEDLFVIIHGKITVHYGALGFIVLHHLSRGEENRTFFVANAYFHRAIQKSHLIFFIPGKRTDIKAGSMNNQVHITGADYKLSAYIFSYIKKSFSGKHHFTLFSPEMIRVIQLAAGLQGYAGTIGENNSTRLGISCGFLEPLHIGIGSLMECPY